MGPLQDIKLGNTYLKQVESSRCLGIENTNLCLYIVNVRDTIINSKIINKNSVMPTNFGIAEVFLKFYAQ